MFKKHPHFGVYNTSNLQCAILKCCEMLKEQVVNRKYTMSQIVVHQTHGNNFVNS